MNLDCRPQVAIDVFYDDTPVGLYYADIIVNNLVIVEIKSAEALCQQHVAQLVNYLKATDIEAGLLFNFGAKPEFKRKVFSAPYKNHYKRSGL